MRLLRMRQSGGTNAQVRGKDVPFAGLAVLKRWWPVMPSGKGWVQVMRMVSVGVYLAAALYCSSWVMACPVREDGGQKALRYSDGLVIGWSGTLGLNIDVEQPLPLAGVPAPGSAEHDLWVPALDVAQLRERLRQGGKGVPPVASPLEQQWQNLLSEHLRQMGVATPEEQKRWLELLHMDEERWRRFLEGIQRRLSQEGKEVPPLPPRNWLPPLDPSKLMQPPLSTDSPLVPPDRPLGTPPQSAPPTPQGQNTALPSPHDPRHRSWDAFRELWERYIGPMDNTPELRNLLLQMMEEGGMAWDLRDSSGRSVWEVLREQMPEIGHGQRGTGDNRSEGASAEGGTEGRRWRWPQWRWPRWSSSLRWGRQGSGGGSWGSLSSGGWDWPALPRQSWWFLAILVILGGAIAALIIRQRQRRFAWLSWPHRPPLLQGQQLVDPRQIQTPEELVRAFEWWSVQLLGPEARHWTHATIARVLHQKAVLQKEQIEELARLYELARYAPEARKLPPEVWMQGRRILCSWAGVSPT